MACAGASAPQPERPERARPAAYSAQAWPAADVLFRGDPRWLGGDAAISVLLDGERVLWLFGDSFIAAEPGQRSRAAARMVRNSVGLQEGLDPSSASMRFYVRATVDGAPASFFPESDTSWFWPGDGLYLDGTVTLFLSRLEADRDSALGFRVAGFGVRRVRDASGPPDRWQLETLPAPDTGELRIVGAELVEQDGFVYAYAVREPGDHAVMLLRWPLSEFERGELLQPSYFEGEARGFGRGPAQPLFGGATEFSVSPSPAGGYVQVQSRGFGAAPIAVRTAPRLTGPFGPQTDVFLPEEAARPGVLLYAARAHPELTGPGLVLTYASNHLEPNTLLSDLALYFPRFVTLSAQ